MTVRMATEISNTAISLAANVIALERLSLLASLSNRASAAVPRRSRERCGHEGSDCFQSFLAVPIGDTHDGENLHGFNASGWLTIARPRLRVVCDLSAFDL